MSKLKLFLTQPGLIAYLFFSYSFFLGDLNFRIDNLTSMEVYDNIILNENSKNPNKWATLLEYDQVRKVAVFLILTVFFYLIIIA